MRGGAGGLKDMRGGAGGLKDMRGGAGETAGYEGRGWGDCRV